MTSSDLFYVTVTDNFSRGSSDAEHIVKGFDNLEHAMTYATRRVRSSLEQMRKKEPTKEKLHHLWLAMGEEVNVEGLRIGLAHFDRFFDHPATAEECDWVSLTPADPDKK